MNISADIHTHTNYSDGKFSPREMLSAAIEKGLDAYGFSDHAHMKIASHWMMAGERTENYIKEINSLKTEFWPDKGSLRNRARYFFGHRPCPV
ncbi:MAG: PHP domain-containing protein [Eubacteriales bacterium]